VDLFATPCASRSRRAAVPSRVRPGVCPKRALTYREAVSPPMLQLFLNRPQNFAVAIFPQSKQLILSILGTILRREKNGENEWPGETVFRRAIGNGGANRAAEGREAERGAQCPASEADRHRTGARLRDP